VQTFHRVRPPKLKPLTRYYILAFRCSAHRRFCASLIFFLTGADSFLRSVVDALAAPYRGLGA
jgi:hypothetical protein